MKNALVAAGILLASLPGLAWAQAETTLNLGFVGGAQAPEAIAMGQHLAKHWKKIGVIHESTAYGVTGLDYLTAALKRLGGSAPVAAESYNQGAQDMTAQVARMKRDGAEVIAAIGLGKDLAVLRRTMARLHYNVPLVASNGALGQPFQRDLPLDQLDLRKHLPGEHVLALFERLEPGGIGSGRRLVLRGHRWHYKEKNEKQESLHRCRQYLPIPRCLQSYPCARVRDTSVR